MMTRAGLLDLGAVVFLYGRGEKKSIDLILSDELKNKI